MTEYHEGDRIEWAELDLSGTEVGFERAGFADDGAPMFSAYLDGQGVKFRVAVLEVTDAVDADEIYDGDDNE